MFKFTTPVNLTAGMNSIALLSIAIGLSVSLCILHYLGSFLSSSFLFNIVLILYVFFSCFRTLGCTTKHGQGESLGQ